MLVAACFFADDGDYPNIKSASVAQRQSLYWRCIAVMCETVKRFSRTELRLVVFSNAKPPPEIRTILDAQHVDIIDLPFETRIPPGASKLFSGSLYTVDALRWCARELPDDEVALFLDPDCVATQDLSPVAEAIRERGLTAYDLRIPHGQAGNGVSRDDMANVLAQAQPQSTPRPPRWLGGEFVGLRGDVARRLAPALDRIWQVNQANFASGKPALRTEEHLLSTAVAAEDLPFLDAGDGFVKRLWTGTRYRNHGPADIENLVWHLPSEKNRGFQRLYRLIGRSSEAWSDNVETRKLALANMFGLQSDRIGEAIYICRRASTEATRLILNRTQQFSVGV